MAVETREPVASFFGRDGELRALLAALERARAGKGGLVALTGDAGIGKTRLVEELIHLAGLPAGRVLWGRCLEQAGAPSYWPWMRVLRAHASDGGLDALRADLGADAPLVAPLVPGLLPPGESPAPAAVAEGRYLLFDAVAGLLRRAAAAHPLVIVLEDVHWADEASLALLEFVAQEIDASHLLLLVTFRERERPRVPRPLLDAVRRGQRVALQGLDREAVAAIMAQATGAPAPAPTVDRLAEVTAGNPFFLGEVLRTLAQEGRLDAVSSPDAPLTVPDTVRDSIRRHLDPLDAEDRDVLALAAVVGQEFEIALLQIALEVDATHVLDRLGAAVQRGLLLQGIAGRFRFAHALVRETVYGDVLPAARVRLHARIGEALERLHGGAASLGALAHHFLHAAPLGTAAKAVDYAARAARQAMSVYAYHDALAAYEQALVALGAQPAVRAQRLALRLAAADAARRAGLSARGRELFREASQDARALGDRAGLARAALGYYQLSPNLRELDPFTVPLLEEALRALAEEDSALRSTLLAVLATARFSLDGGEANAALGAQAVDMARRIGDETALATALLSRQLVVVGAGSTAARLALADEALALTERGARGLEHLARAARTQCFLELGEVGAARGEVERMAEAAERLRQPERRWQVTVRRASIALLEGRFDDGARLAAEALAVRREVSDSMAVQVFFLQMFLARRDTGQHGGLEGSLRWMVEHSLHAQMWRCVLAVYHADLAREAEARAIFEELAADRFARIQHQNHAASLAWLARVCTFLRDLPRAYQIYPRLAPYADQNIVLGPDSQACLGSTHRYLGLLAMTGGMIDAAEEHFRAAIAMNERMGARPVTACCQHEYARALEYRNRPGDRTRARELIEQARATSLACGMSQLLEWIERLGFPEPEAASTVGIAAPVALAASSPPPSPTLAVLRRDGDVWQVGLGADRFSLKDAKGVHLLATLLRHPGQEIHVLDLAAGVAGAIAAGEVPDRGDAGPLLDPVARAAYKSRLEDLRDELEEAERFNDPARAERARLEIEFLADELARGVGLGGRERRAASAAERARVNATRTIGGVVKKISALSPRLGEHLRATVRTGYYCVYAPDPTSPIRWQL
jgi:tetratricopeptide (TPR) repeat protein